MRFLSDLVNCHVIAAPSMMAMFENFVSVTQEEDVPQVAGESMCNDSSNLFTTLKIIREFMKFLNLVNSTNCSQQSYTLMIKALKS